ncbi:hypothetical protein VM1G_09580 [Cytospora mali]|uniref:Rhodopsin domain-containing protein n=1 Tax=Cytospora mali TaxID=578113 RepID=A0A194WCE0_CYTMA|nr:hypothetical protein VM1G_09580 [Valsa mali]
MSGIATTRSALAIGFCFPIIDGILVGLRFYTRRHLKTDLQADDWLCIPAWVALPIDISCTTLIKSLGVFKGAYGDAAVTDPEHVTEQEHTLAQVLAALVIFWMGANFCVKLIMLFFYRRIFVGRVFNICNWILIGLSVIWFVYAILSWLLYCGKNLEANFEGGWLVCPLWGFDIQMGVFALDSFIDLCLLVLPIPFVWRLQLDLKRKIAITIVFIIGGFAFVAGLNNTIVQLVYLTEPSLAAEGGGANFFQGSSLLFSNWPAIEVGVGLLASNLPHLSFRLARAFAQSLPRVLRISLDSLRNAAAAISLQSPRHSQGSGHRAAPKYESPLQGAESSQSLYPQLAGQHEESTKRAVSLEQRSAHSAQSIELRDLEANR